MIHEIDNWLIDRLETATLWAQRRGIKLTNIHVVTMLGTTLANIAAQDNPIGKAFCGVAWGAWLLGYTKWAIDNKDYPEIIKKMNRLNAKVLLYREIFPSRCFWWFLMVVWMSGAVSDALAHHWSMVVADVLAWAFPALDTYLCCCSYVGPGEFAKQRKESTSGHFAHHTL